MKIIARKRSVRAQKNDITREDEWFREISCLTLKRWFRTIVLVLMRHSLWLVSCFLSPMRINCDDECTWRAASLHVKQCQVCTRLSSRSSKVFISSGENKSSIASSLSTRWSVWSSSSISLLSSVFGPGKVDKVISKWLRRRPPPFWG